MSKNQLLTHGSNWSGGQNRFYFRLISSSSTRRKGRRTSWSKIMDKKQITPHPQFRVKGKYPVDIAVFKNSLSYFRSD